MHIDTSKTKKEEPPSSSADGGDGAGGGAGGGQRGWGRDFLSLAELKKLSLEVPKLMMSLSNVSLFFMLQRRGGGNQLEFFISSPVTGPAAAAGPKCLKACCELGETSKRKSDGYPATGMSDLLLLCGCCCYWRTEPVFLLLVRKKNRSCYFLSKPSTKNLRCPLTPATRES